MRIGVGNTYHKGYFIVAHISGNKDYYWFEIFKDAESVYVSHYDDQHKTPESALTGGKIIIDEHPDRLIS